MERVASFQNPLLFVSRVPPESSSDKRNFSLLSKALEKEFPRAFERSSPKLGPYGNRRPFPEPYLAYPSGSPVKQPSVS